MNSRHLKLLFVCLPILLSVTGCVSVVNIEKIDPDKEVDCAANDQQPCEAGIRFALPKPYIVMKPDEKGAYEAEVIYLPDPDAHFAISTDSYFSKTDLKVTVAEGILTGINSTRDSSAVGTEVAKSLGSYLTAQKESEEEDEKKAQTSLSALKGQLAAAQLKVEIAQEQVNHWEAKDGSAYVPALIAATNALISAQKELASIEAQLSQLGASGAAFNDPKNAIPDKDNVPVFYAILDDGNQLKLKRANIGKIPVISPSTQPITGHSCPIEDGSVTSSESGGKITVNYKTVPTFTTSKIEIKQHIPRADITANVTHNSTGQNHTVIFDGKREVSYILILTYINGTDGWDCPLPEIRVPNA